jgi:formate hydrogenlyase subunit 4
VSWLSVAGAVVQPVIVVAGAPALVGVTGQVRARLTGRAGAGVLQPYRELRKLLRKEPSTPDGASEVFRFAPVVLAAATLVVAVVAPLVTAESAVGPVADVVAVVGLLVLGSVALALSGVDGGGAFGALGAGRVVTILALSGPALLVAMLAPAVRAGSTNLAVIVSSTVHEPSRMITPASLLAAAAILIVIIAESGLRPVDGPAPAEPAMARRATVLEYAGPDLALVELASAARLALFLGLLANLFVPWGIATEESAAGLAVGVVALAVKITLLAGALAVSEVFLARLRAFRVPELLAGAFVLAGLAVSASLFLS